MKILLIAYACEPYKGSEPGVGWNWAINLSKYVNVIVITRANNKSVIEKELRDKSYSNISFIYYDIPILDKIKKIIPFGIQTYYLLWEFFLNNKINIQDTDIIQRLTFVSTASILRLYKINKPYIMSFCAGGEKTPISISKNYSIIDKLKEKLRIIYNSAYKYNLITRNLFNKSSKIIAVTEETKTFIKNFGISEKVITLPAIGVYRKSNVRKKNKLQKIIYAGSIIYLKNVDIIVKSISNTNTMVTLEIYGKGNKEKQINKIFNSLDLKEKVKFKGVIARDKLLNRFKLYDLAIHASSHDSGSMFILEAISNGVPVLFLDTGGPKEIFKGLDYPLKVSPNQSYNEIVKSFSEKIDWYYDNYEEFNKKFIFLREKILEKYDWENKVKRMVEIYKEVLNENSSDS